MGNIYILNTLCSTPPYVYKNNIKIYCAYNCIQYDKDNLLLSIIKINNNSQIQNDCSLIYKLVVDDYIQQTINFRRNKSTFCLFILAKIRYITNIFQKYNNQLGNILLEDNIKIQKYHYHSNYINDYIKNYSYAELYKILYDINKIISQNITCIKQNYLDVFKIILSILSYSKIDNKFKEKINPILLNDNILLKVLYKYIKNTNYYIEIGELFKNV